MCIPRSSACLVVFANCSKEARNPNVVAFLAYRENGDGVTAGSAVVFETVAMNLGGAYDSSSGIFTAPVHGLYQATTSARPANSDSFCAVGHIM